VHSMCIVRYVCVNSSYARLEYVKVYTSYFRCTLQNVVVMTCHCHCVHAICGSDIGAICAFLGGTSIYMHTCEYIYINVFIYV